MIYWITGRAGSGKTTMAYRIAKQCDGIVIDADDVRKLFPCGFTDEDRYQNIMRIAKIAKLIEDQGRIVIVACVSPKRVWRKEAQAMFKECLEIQLPFGSKDEWTLFEEQDEQFA